MKLLVLAAVLLCTSAAFGQSIKESGSSLFHTCKEGVVSLDMPAGSDPHGMREAAICIAYFQGYIDALAPNSGICLQGASFDAAIRGYINYMENHPKALDLHRSVGLGAALQMNYPCVVGPA